MVVASSVDQVRINVPSLLLVVCMRFRVSMSGLAQKQLRLSRPLCALLSTLCKYGYTLQLLLALSVTVISLASSHITQVHCDMMHTHHQFDMSCRWTGSEHPLQWLQNHTARSTAKLTCRLSLNVHSKAQYVDRFVPRAVRRRDLLKCSTSGAQAASKIRPVCCKVRASSRGGLLMHTY